MRIINELPLLKSCLQRWEKKPTQKQFEQEYIEPLRQWITPLLEDFEGRTGTQFYEVIEGLNWDLYRQEAFWVDAAKEEARLSWHIKDVERLLGVKLEGETVLFGAFTMMDGYARFDRGTHRVFLGVDESHGRGRYLDILITHELTHVARESEATVWEGFGLNPKMTHDEFVENQPVVEHLFSEGFSCVVSELLNPDECPWNYAYQTEDTLSNILQHSIGIDQVIHGELKKDKAGDYGALYNVQQYTPPAPMYAHYVWAWKWVKHLVETHGKGSVKSLLKTSSAEFLEDALKFKL